MRCTDCGSSKTSKRMSAMPLDTMRGRSYQYYKCADCGLVFLDHKPSIDDYKGSGFYQKAESRIAKLLNPLMLFFNRARFRHVARYSKKTGSVLDIGCGRGRFLHVAGRNGWKVYGIEPNERSADYARNHFGVELLKGGIEDGKAVRQKFDAVTMWHVLEHFQNPSKVINDAADFMSKDGILVIAVPNINSVQGLIGRARWFHLDPPRHLCHFDPVTITRLIEKNGLKVAAIHHFSLEFNFMGMVQTAQNLIQSTPNFIFNYLKKNSRALPENMGAWISGFLTSGVVALLSPILLMLCFLESLLRMGGTMTVVARKAD